MLLHMKGGVLRHGKRLHLVYATTKFPYGPRMKKAQDVYGSGEEGDEDKEIVRRNLRLSLVAA